MIAAFNQIAPFFCVVLLGYLLARPGLLGPRGLFADSGVAALNTFIFQVALPPMLFLATSRSPKTTDGGFDLLLGYGVATIGLYLAMRVAAYAFFRLKGGENALFGYVSINGNAGFLGLPLIALTLGEEALLPAAMVLSFDIMVMMSGTAIQLEALKSGGNALRGFVRAIISPIPIAVIAGFAWGWATREYGVALPDPVERFLTLLAQAAAPAALFATGAVLATKQGDERVGEIGLMTAAKLVAHPMLVALSLAYLAPDLPPLWAAAAVLAAACPTSNNAVLLAANFGSYEARASAVALISTALSILTYAVAASWVQG